MALRHASTAPDKHHKPSDVTLTDGTAAPESLHPDLPSFLSCVLFGQGWVNRKYCCRVCSLPREVLEERGVEKGGTGLSFTYSQNSMTGEVAFSLVTLSVEFAFWSSMQFPAGEVQGKRESK